MSKRLDRIADTWEAEAVDEEMDDASPDQVLWDANPKCKHVTYCAPGGGIKCRHCPGWFCY